MNIINSYSNQFYFKKATKEVNQSQNCQKENKHDYKKIALTLGILSAIGVASAATVIKIKNNKMPNPKEGIALLKQIKFENGIATIKNTGEEYTGKIIDKLKNGDKIILNYADGKIISSKRTGSVNINKSYYYGKNSWKKIITKFADGRERIFKGENNWHTITEDGRVIKEFFNNKSNMVANSFDKKYGILTSTTVFDKASKKIKKISNTEAMNSAEKIRQLFPDSEYTVIERFKNGVPQKVKLKDGTIRDYNSSGRVIKESKNGIESVIKETKDFQTVSTFPDGTTRIFDSNHTLIFESYPNGIEKSYYSSNGMPSKIVKDGEVFNFYRNGQPWCIDKNGIRTNYRENGTIESIFNSLNNTLVEYDIDGITKKFERFEDGSSIHYAH